MPIFAQVYLGHKHSYVPESTWVKNLHYKKLKLTKLEEFNIKEILEDTDIKTEVLLQKLDKVNELSDDVATLKNKIKKELHNYNFVLEKENQMVAEANAETSSPEQIALIKKTREAAEERFKNYKDDIKKMIKRDYEVKVEKREHGWR